MDPPDTRVRGDGPVEKVPLGMTDNEGAEIKGLGLNRSQLYRADTHCFYTLMLQPPCVTENLYPGRCKAEEGSSRSQGREGRELPGRGPGLQECAEVLWPLFPRPHLRPLG